MPRDREARPASGAAVKIANKSSCSTTVFSGIQELLLAMWNFFTYEGGHLSSKVYFVENH